MKRLKHTWFMCGAVSGSILTLFIILNCLGWRENMTVLTGTIPQGANLAGATVKALVYMASYFASLLLVPILLLTSGISYSWTRLHNKGETF